MCHREYKTNSGTEDRLFSSKHCLPLLLFGWLAVFDCQTKGHKKQAKDAGLRISGVEQTAASEGCVEDRAGTLCSEEPFSNF